MSEPFNKLTPAEVERLALLAEECAEVVQVIGKILRHGYNSCHPRSSTTNREMLMSELGDVRAAEEIMVEAQDINNPTIVNEKHRKYERVLSFLHEQPARIRQWLVRQAEQI